MHDVDSQTLLRILLHALYCPVVCQTLPSTEGGELLYCTYYTILYFIINITSLYYTVLCYSSWLFLKILVLYYPIFLNYSTLKSLYVSTFCGGTEKSWAPVRNSTMFYHTITRLCFYQHSTGEHTMIYHIKLYITVLFYPLLPCPHVWTFLLVYAILVLRLFNTAHNFTLLHCSPVLCSIP